MNFHSSAWNFISAHAQLSIRGPALPRVRVEIHQSAPPADGADC